MTKRDFFRILIKLFALYGLILNVFNYLPYNFSYMAYANDSSIYFMLLGFVLLTVAFFVIIVWKTDAIINFLKLDKGFDDERIEFQNFNVKNIIKFALIFIGGFFGDRLSALISSKHLFGFQKRGDRR